MKPKIGKVSLRRHSTVLNELKLHCRVVRGLVDWMAQSQLLKFWDCGMGDACQKTGDLSIGFGFEKGQKAHGVLRLGTGHHVD